MYTMLTGAVFVTLLSIQHECSGYYWESKGNENMHDSSILDKPEFEDTEKEVAVSIGRTAILPCRVKNIGDKKVSWIRTKDLHILTYDRDTFTSDVRFSTSHSGGNNWGLRLRNSQPSDTGTYECQVNTEPKLNRKVHLEVDENLGDSPYILDSNAVEDVVGDISKSGPTTRILGQEEQFVQPGSTVTLTCLVLPTDSRHNNVDWLKDGRLVSFQAARGGISTHTDRSEKRTTSNLIIADVTPVDSGNYSCRPHRGPHHSIQLLVIEGERSEAVQGAWNISSSVNVSSFFLLFLCNLTTFFNL